MSSTDKGNRGGHPSITTPIPPPWLSPQELILNSVPNELPMVSFNLFYWQKAKGKDLWSRRLKIKVKIR
jgi:hypothetical protein